MGFTRNLHYLRISEKIVLPLYLYIDIKYLDWMSDHILQHILSDLQPRVLPKLMMESEKFGQASGGKKKEELDTHRGETYQFCYFLRRMEPHSIVLKTRNYVARVTEPSVPPPPPTSTTHAQKRKVSVSSSHGRSSRSSKKARKARAQDNMNVDEIVAVEVSSKDVIGRRKMKRNINIVIDVDGDEDMVDNDDDEEYRPDTDDTNRHSDMDQDPVQDILDLTVDEEEEKPKPALQLNYKGFHVYAQCLCVVVEPWPRPEPKTKSTLRTTRKFKENNKSIQPSNTLATRSTTPLFLADEDDFNEEESSRLVAYQHTWDTSGEDDSDDEMGGMMAFSQALNLLSDVRPGAAADEDEMDDGVLLGDADEARGM